MVARTKVNVEIADDTLAKLDRLADYWQESRRDAIERAIERAYTREQSVIEPLEPRPGGVVYAYPMEKEMMDAQSVKARFTLDKIKMRKE